MTARKVNQVLWDEWRQPVKRQRESGLSIAEFWRQEKVSSHKFHVWKRKLRQAESGEPRSGVAVAKRSVNQREADTPRRGPCHTVAGPAVPNGSPSFLELPVTAIRPSPFIEVTLADGTSIRLPQQNMAALVTTLQVLHGNRRELEGCHA